MYKFLLVLASSVQLGRSFDHVIGDWSPAGGPFKTYGQMDLMRVELRIALSRICVKVIWLKKSKIQRGSSRVDAVNQKRPRTINFRQDLLMNP